MWRRVAGLPILPRLAGTSSKPFVHFNPAHMARIALIPGDGVGPEVLDEAHRILRILGRDPDLSLELESLDLGAERFLATGSSITDEEFERLAGDFDAILLGALGDPRVPGNEHARDILLGLRFRLDLYINYRPCRVQHPRLSPLRHPDGDAMDLQIFRENTEGIYTGAGGVIRAGSSAEIAIEEDINTRHGVERIIRAAFEFAEREGRERVTLVDKANAMPFGGALWRRAFGEVAAGYPAIQTERMYVDAMVMDLVRRPDYHQVVVTSNLFGDILSDLAAALTGGLGLAPSANLHPGRHALFEPVHGSAPDIAGTGRANPMAAILCVALLMDHLERPDLARRVEGVVAEALDNGMGTPDVGGDATTEEVGQWIAGRLAMRTSPGLERVDD
jgi:3-isopropylmalate dehydrogenase